MEIKTLKSKFRIFGLSRPIPSCPDPENIRIRQKNIRHGPMSLEPYLYAIIFQFCINKKSAKKSRQLLHMESQFPSSQFSFLPSLTPRKK